MEKVFLAQCRTYENKRLGLLIAKGLEETGFVLRPGITVLLKPNLVMGRPPQKAVNTHPVLVAAVAEILLDHGCRVFVGDSPGYESTERALKRSGIGEIVSNYGLSVAPFNSKIKKTVKGLSPYKEFLFAEDPDRYDLVVNLPKLKTHAMMGLTMGVKNTFGFVYSLEKARWHLRAGRDPLMFASVLIDIHTLVNPGITIIDGIIGMDGDGPTHGHPRKLGILGISRNAFALDRALEAVLWPTGIFPISVVAGESGLIPHYEVSTDGDVTERDIRMPRSMSTQWDMPGRVRGVLKSIFLKKPVILGKVCKRCHICVEVCPSGALSAREGDCPAVDYGKCIRCYCCQEMCPEGAVRIG